MVVEKSKYPSRHKVREFTRPTITLQDVLRQWYKVLWIWWGSFGTKYDHHTYNKVQARDNSVQQYIIHKVPRALPASYVQQRAHSTTEDKTEVN